MAAIDAISKGSIGLGQAAGKANAGPASGFDLLFDVSSGAPTEGGRPAFVDGLVSPSSGLPVIGASAMKSPDVVAPLSEAELDAEWSFATVVSAPEVSDDLKADTQVLGCMMPLPVQEDVFLATPPMTSSAPLISDNDEKDLASFDEADAGWRFATVVSAPEVSDDQKTATQVLGRMMPLLVQEDVFLATPPMTSSAPLISDDDEKDLASFDEADVSLALAVFSAVITPSMAPPDPEAESNSKHQLLGVVASGQPIFIQGELGKTSNPGIVLEHSGLVLQDQPNTKDAPPLSFTSEAQLLSKGEEGQISDPALVSEPAKAALKVKPEPEDGGPNTIKQSGSPQPHVGRTTTVASSAQMQTAEDARDDSGDVMKSESQPATTTVARLRINPAMTLPAEPLAVTELAVAATREYPAQLRDSTEAASIAPEKFDQLQSGSKAQTVSVTLGPNLATMLPERTNESSLPNSTAPMMAQLRQTLDTRDASWREQLVTQVLGSARDGTQSISITLRPKSLGDIQLNIEINTSETTVRIITETASSARLLLANEDMLSHLMDQAGVRLTSMTTQHMTMTGLNGLSSGQSTAQNSGGQSGRDGAGGRKERVRGAEPPHADSAPILKLGDSSQLSINLMA